MRHWSASAFDQIDGGIALQRVAACCHPMRRYPAARCNPILPFNSKRSRLPNPAVRGVIAAPVGETSSKVRFARYPTKIDAKCGHHFLQADLRLRLSSTNLAVVATAWIPDCH